MTEHEPKFFFENAVAAQNAGNFAEAVELCNRGLALNPDSIEGLQKRGMAYYFTRDLEKSLQDFQQVLRLDPNNRFAHLRNVICFGELGDLDASLRSLALYQGIATESETTLEFEQEIMSLSSKAQLDLGSRLLDASRTAEALAVFDSLMNSDVTPLDFPVVFTLVMRNSSCETAMNYFEGSGITKDLTSEQGLGLAGLVAESGNEDAAERIRIQTLENNPRDWSCCVNIGWRAFQKNDLLESEKLLRRAVSVDPTNPDSVGLLAWVLAAEGVGEAKNKESLELALKLQTMDDYPAHKKLKIRANSEASNRMFARAGATIKQILELVPNEDVSSIVARINPGELEN